MIETNLNIFDTIVVVVMFLSCLIAFFRGFVREILSLGAWVGAGIITLYYFPTIAEYVEPHVKSKVVATGIGTLGIYISALIFFSTINWLILKLMKSGDDVGVLDNMLGLMFGAFRGAFIISLGFFILTIVMPPKEYPDWLKNSITRPYVENGATILASMSPEYLRELTSLSKEARDLAEKRNEDINYDDSWLDETQQTDDDEATEEPVIPSSESDHWQDMKEEF